MKTSSEGRPVIKPQEPDIEIHGLPVQDPPPELMPEQQPEPPPSPEPEPEQPSTSDE